MLNQQEFNSLLNQGYSRNQAIRILRGGTIQGTAANAQNEIERVSPWQKKETNSRGH